ncbi:MAG: nuclear transport factor 2 family protein [Chloroflexi bacterium]|nr:MAG: nuclear transport factor 2 family protein [Chloroflexota bacterium]
MGKYEDISKKAAETFNKHDLDAYAKLYAEDAVAYDPMYPEPLRGRAAIRKDAATFLRGFPDIRFEIVSTIEKDDRAFCASSASCRNPRRSPLARSAK